MISELLASDSFVLKLNVFQLVHKLACITAHYNLRCGGERLFKDEILVKCLWVEDEPYVRVYIYLFHQEITLLIV